MCSNTAEYTWQEVRKHNTVESRMWVAIEGKVYDITDFLSKHPGGQELLKISAGRDCTDLFNSYHNLTKRPLEILPKYQIGVLSTYELNQFKPDSGFYKECCERVRSYFEENELHPKTPWYGLWRLALFVGLLALSYMSFNFLIAVPMIVRILAAVVFGVCQALCLLHQMHDASHSAIGYTPIWWKIISRITMEWIAGASIMSWFHQHILGHHVYTNIMGSDPDLPSVLEDDLRFLVKRQIWKNSYKFQYLYMPVLYGLLAIKFRIQDFTWTFFSEANGPIHVNPLSKVEWLHLISTKMFWFFYRLIVPIYILGIPTSTVLFYFFLAELVTGYWLAINFQVSHISTEAFFPCSDKIEPSLKEEWAVIQVMTSVDYGHGSFLQTFLSGALNYQTIHHLFPGISQYHYPAIAPIVMEVCKKHGVPFNVLPSFKDAFWAHIMYMYNMGNQMDHLKAGLSKQVN
jgi:cytochrome b involved in lipid metabolism